ncbi:MAG: helix-turn-helix transcriptional regulator, partial [Bacteroidota bacterium]
ISLITTVKPKYNRLRILLAERDKNAAWLASQLGRHKTGVARWCANQQQPPVPVLYDIAEVLGVTVHDILVAERP